jgi:hypothetical protein
MGLSKTFWRRTIVAAMLAMAFVVMASVFSPYRSQADQPIRPSIAQSGTVGINGRMTSSDAHEGLSSLGSIETSTFLVQIYSTAEGPRYSIYDRNTRRELGTLLSAEQVEKGFPEICLPVADFSMPDAQPDLGPLMIAEPVAPDTLP